MSSGEGHLENSIGHIPEGLLKDAMSTVLPVPGVGGGHPLNGECQTELFETGSFENSLCQVRKGIGMEGTGPDPSFFG